MDRIYGFFGLMILILMICILRQWKKNKLWKLFQDQSTKELEKELEKTSTRILIKAYYRENLKLNCYLMEKNQKKIDDQFEKLLKVHKNPLSNQEFLTKMFNHYLFEENNKQCNKILKHMEEDSIKIEVVNESKMLYRIFFEGCADYIEPLKRQLKKLSEEQKGMAAYYISVQYRNLGNRTKQKEYEQLSKTYLS